MRAAIAFALSVSVYGSSFEIVSSGTCQNGRPTTEKECLEAARATNIPGWVDPGYVAWSWTTDRGPGCLLRESDPPFVFFNHNPESPGQCGAVVDGDKWSCICNAAPVCESMPVDSCDMPVRKNGRNCYARCCKSRAGCTWNRLTRECQPSTCSLHPKLGKNCGPRCCKNIQDLDNCEWNKTAKTCDNKPDACFTGRTQPSYKSP